MQGAIGGRGAVGVVGLAVVLGCLSLTAGHNWGDDFALYVRQAQSLAEGTAAHFADANRFTNEHTVVALGPLAYPWGYPLLLSPVYAVFGLNFIAFKAVNVAGYAAALLCLGALFAPRLPRPLFLLMLGLFAVSPAMLGALDNVLSDIPFMAVSLLGLALLDRLFVAEAGGPYRRWLLGLTGAAVGFAALVRTNGMLLFPVLLLCQVVAARRPAPGGWRGNAVDVLLPYATAGVLLLAVNAWLPDGGMSHAAMLHPNLKIVLGNAAYYFRLPAEFLNCAGSLPVSALLLVLGLIGWAEVGRREYHFSAYVGLTVGMYLVWPAQQGLRFLYPVLPFLAYFVVRGLVRACSWLGERAGRWVPPAVLGATAAALLVASAQQVRQNWSAGCRPDGPLAPASRQMFDYLRTQTPAGAVVVFFKPRAAQLFTGRPAFATDRPADLRRADFVVLRKGGGGSPQVAELPTAATGDVFDPVYENPQFRVYRRSSPR